MSNRLTIDRILAECKEDFGSTEKVANEVKSFISDTEIDKMASELQNFTPVEKSASSNEVTVYEKLAESLVISSTLNFIANENEKLDLFKTAAIKQGFNEKEVESFVEAKVMEKMASLLSSPILKNTMILGSAAGLAGTGGYVFGKKKEHEKGVQVANQIGRDAFMLGRKIQNQLDMQGN